ncbi:hypothetical protein Hanom_Chr17g01577511 [Helianthus anomalus]
MIIYFNRGNHTIYISHHIFSLSPEYTKKKHIVYLITIHGGSVWCTIVMIMSPVISEALLSGFPITSTTLSRRTHSLHSFSVVFLYWFYVFS